MGRHVALKVVKSAPRYTETALDEIKLLQRLITSTTHPVQPTPENPDPPPSPSQTHPGRSHVISFLDHFKHKGPNGTHVCMVFEVLGENLLGLIKRHQNKGVPMHLVKQIAKQVLSGLDYMHRCCGVIHTGPPSSSLWLRLQWITFCTDLKPENVLICIEDVESIIEAEMAAAANTTSPPSRLIGVPPSKGRGGNQTPRSQSVFITGSQPLPSPSSSFGSPMLDPNALRMSKIGDEDTSKSGSYGSPSASKESSGSVPAASLSGPEGSSITGRADSTEVTAARISTVSLDSGFDKMTTPHPANPPGPSLLTQMAPNHPSPGSPSLKSQVPATARPAGSGDSALSNPKLSTSVIPGESPQPSFAGTSTSSSILEGTEKITVKIADLGNGGLPFI